MAPLLCGFLDDCDDVFRRRPGILSGPAGQSNSPPASLTLEERTDEIIRLIPRSRFEVFAEGAPVLDLAPSTTLEWNGGIGLRYYFH